MTRAGVWTAAVLLAAVAPCPSSAQDVARRIADMEDGTARMTYPARPDVEICDQGIRMGDHRMWWNHEDGDRLPTNCRPGPVEVELDLRRGEVRDVDVIRDRDDRTPGAVDLGEVSAQEAVAYFLDLAREGTDRAGEDVIFPAILADVQNLWMELLAMAREESVRKGVRTSALFWVGQEAANAATEGLADVAFDEDEDQDVREAAVFALSQRPAEEGVPILMRLARTAEQAGTRRSAMFWLAQSEDERVLAFFEEVLLGRGGA